jgi:hypothetical protein
MTAPEVGQLLIVHAGGEKRNPLLEAGCASAARAVGEKLPHIKAANTAAKVVFRIRLMDVGSPCSSSFYRPHRLTCEYGACFVLIPLKISPGNGKIQCSMSP